MSGRQFRNSFPLTVRNRKTGELVELDPQAYCPRCGFRLTDPDFLERMPQPGSWFNSDVAALCEHCGAAFRVKATIEDLEA